MLSYEVNDSLRQLYDTVDSDHPLTNAQKRLMMNIIDAVQFYWDNHYVGDGQLDPEDAKVLEMKVSSVFTNKENL